MSSRPTSPHPDIHVDHDGHVTTVTLDNPAAKNACTGDMWVALGSLFSQIAYSGARAVVLTGAGGDFCAGADLSGSGAPRDEADESAPAGAGRSAGGDAGARRRGARRARVPGAGGGQGRRGMRGGRPRPRPRPPT